MPKTTNNINIIPKAQAYLDENYNVMLIGLHGVGKTEAVLALVRERGLVLKYYSCSTLDPFTDLVGVPTPRKFCTGCEVWYGTTKDECPICHTMLKESLRMVRPLDIDAAEFLFFDEFNRADPKTLNAIFEVIQFHSINGEKLDNIRCSWAAMNPPGDDYDVEDLDPALVDRFDIYEDVKPRPSVQWMANEGGLPKPVAMALHSWWIKHNGKRRGLDHYISPRRLHKMGKVFMAIGDFRPALPKWVDADRNALAELLERAKAEVDGVAKTDAGGDLASGPITSIQYEAGWIADNDRMVANYLVTHPDDFMSHQAVLDAIAMKHGKTLARTYGRVLQALKPSLVEGFVNSMNPGKAESFKSALVGDRDLALLRKILNLG